MDEMPVLGTPQRDSGFQVTWQGHWAKIIGFLVAGSRCKCKQSAVLYGHCLTVSSLALVPVAEELDFCLYKSVSGRGRQQLPWHTAATQVYVADGQLHCQREIIDSPNKPIGSPAAKSPLYNDGFSSELGIQQEVCTGII